jgi:hypothetical protein
VTLSHASALKKIHSILSLGQEQAVCGTSDGDAEEVMKIAKVRHGELRAEFGYDVLKIVEDDAVRMMSST